MSRGRVLLVEDDPATLELAKATLESGDFVVMAHPDAEAGLQALEGGGVDVVLTDHDLPGMTGVELCEAVARQYSDVPTVILTGQRSLDVAVAAIRAGAHDFLNKPLEPELLFNTLDRAVQLRTLREELASLQDSSGERPSVDGLVGESPALDRALHLIQRAARTDFSVLLLGETGTGKEVFARALHDMGARREGPFIAVNCAAIPGELLESELFGHARGAFTDAKTERKGLFVDAQGGTLFLDEIGDMSETLQAKLLRVLQERRLRPVGASAEVELDVRVVAATHTDLQARVQEGRFRQDLLYRLNVIEVPLPPLRQRGADVLVLANHFLHQAAATLHEAPEAFALSPQAAACLLRYEWPGNVRELRNAMERAVTLSETATITPADLPDTLQDARQRVGPAEDTPLEAMGTLAQVEAEYVGQVLAAAGGNKALAAQTLGIDRTTLYRKLARYGIGAG